VLKAELHAHTSDDPRDCIPHSTTDLIDRAACLGYQVLAVTLHDRCFDPSGYVAYAQTRGVVLIRGIERTIERRHVLLLNFDDGARRVDSFEKLAALRRENPRGLVIAPHPFYPGQTCLGRLLDRHPDLFDALEYNAFYTRALNMFNDAALEWAARHGKPIVGNSDVHRLQQLGKTYTLIDAEPDADALCAAIRAGRVEMRTAPLSTGEALAHAGALAMGELRRLLRPPARRVPESAVIEVGK